MVNQYVLYLVGSHPRPRQVTTQGKVARRQIDIPGRTLSRGSPSFALRSPFGLLAEHFLIELSQLRLPTFDASGRAREMIPTDSHIEVAWFDLDLTTDPIRLGVHPRFV